MSGRSFAHASKRVAERADWLMKSALSLTKFIYIYINCAMLHCRLAGWLAGWLGRLYNPPSTSRARAQPPPSLVQRRAILPRLTNLFFDSSKAARELWAQMYLAMGTARANTYIYTHLHIVLYIYVQLAYTQWWTPKRDTHSISTEIFLMKGYEKFTNQKWDLLTFPPNKMTK